MRATEAYGLVVTQSPRLRALIPCHVMLHRAKFHETAAQHIRKQLQLLKAELPLPPENDSNLASMAAAGFGSHVLEDDQDDDGDQSGVYICLLPNFNCGMPPYSCASLQHEDCLVGRLQFDIYASHAKQLLHAVMCLCTSQMSIE